MNGEDRTSINGWTISDANRVIKRICKSAGYTESVTAIGLINKNSELSAEDRVLLTIALNLKARVYELQYQRRPWNEAANYKYKSTVNEIKRLRDKEKIIPRFAQVLIDDRKNEGRWTKKFNEEVEKLRNLERMKMQSDEKAKDVENANSR